MVRSEIPLALVALVFLSIGDALFPLIRGKANEWLIDALTNAIGSGVVTTHIGWIFVLFAVVTIYGGIAGYTINYVSTIVFERVTTTTDLILRAAMARLDVAHYEDPEFMDTVDKASGEGIRRIRQFLDNQLSVLIFSATVAISAVAIGYQKLWLLPILVLATVPELLVRSQYARKIWVLRTQQAEFRRRLSYFKGYFGSVASLIELKINGIVPHFLDRMKDALHTLLRNEIEYTKKQTQALTIAGFIGYAGVIFALYMFTLDVVHGVITVGRLVFLLSTMVAFRSTLAQLFRYLSSNYEHTLFLRDVFALLDAAPRVPRPEHPQKIDFTSTPEICFERVSFSYPSSKVLVLKDVTFTIKPGEKIALVGVNGAGKTTIIKLLCRFYDPTEGRITINGIDLKEVDLDSWYRALGILFQDFTTYRALTVREAIQIGDTRHVSGGSIEDAARKAEADSFIEALPNTYNQMLGKSFKGGTEPSGGQRQKLALARVFYRNPRVWVLDEPTAAIDAESEAHIFDRIEQTLEGRSAIIISHRFSTVRNAHRILVLKEGTISEQGTHQELMKLKQDYARLFTMQAKRYQGNED